jgi:glycosyltransferase involved in cell wall biosynthesis
MLPYKNIYHSGLMHLAYSFSKPVIATRVGDFEETIKEGKSGFLVDKGDVSGMAKTIDEAFNDKRNLKEMGQFARKLSEQEYSWKVIASKTNDLYNSISS